MSTTDFWLKGLNPEQVQAVLHDHGPMLILAGAGSGKTTVLVSRTGRLIQSKVVRADQVLVLTFTNKAARELKHRVQNKIGEHAKGLLAGTFHSFGLQLLKKYWEQAGLPKDFGIIDATDAQAIIKDLLKEIKVVGKDRFDLERVLSIVNRRRTGEYLKNQAFDEYDEVAEVLTEKFVRRMDVLGVVDFEALLLKPIELFEKNPDILERVQNQYQQIMVDEFQDTNLVQMKLIRLLSKKNDNLTVVGDDDQSIYGWRGAKIENILSFPKENKNCKVVKLERNYRSFLPILDLANQVIAKNKNRHGKVLRAEKKNQGGTGAQLPELFILEREEDESELIVSEIQRLRGLGRRLKDMAVLYRSNSQGAWIESALRKNRIEYSISGGSSIFDRKEIKDIIAYLRQSVYPQDVTFKRIINTPPRGIGDTTIEKLNQFAQTHKISFLLATKKWREAEIHEKAGESLDSLQKFLWTLPSYLIEGSGDMEFENLNGSAAAANTPGERLLKVLRHIGYRDYLLQMSRQPGAGDKRWNLVEIFSRILDAALQKRGCDQHGLREFLDSLMLRDDDSDDESKDEVQLMTLHASKGLEFPVVILCGVEEDLLPHKSLGSDVDEERRLFYVGLTRAQEHLILTRCQQRLRNGVVKRVSPSRFLLEIPKDLYTEFAQGVRPVSGAAREELVAKFLKSLDKSTPS